MNEPFKPFEVTNTASAKRDDSRDSMLLKAILRFPPSEDEREVRIRNLSSGGLMAAAPACVARGEKIEVNLRNIGWISGSVVWVAEERLGIAFDHPINPTEARKPVTSGNSDLPPYLRKLNRRIDPKTLRHV